MWSSWLVGIRTKAEANQKLDYIHNNPVNGKWQLADDYFSYHYFSASFYETGVDEFGYLTNIFTALYGEGWASVPRTKAKGNKQFYSSELCPICADEKNHIPSSSPFVSKSKTS